MSSVSTVLRALDFAARRHRAQRRKGPDDIPYVNHLIEVAALLSSYGGVADADVLAAAVLHDVVEDTETTVDEVEVEFGPRVRLLVAALTDEPGLSRSRRRADALERLRSAGPDVRLIKLADLCSNVVSLPVDWSRQRCREYLDWSAEAARLCAGLAPALDELYRERYLVTRAASS